MLIKNGKEYYPLNHSLLKKDGKTYYNGQSRQKSYFYLDFRADYVPPADPNPPLPFQPNTI